MCTRTSGWLWPLIAALLATALVGCIPPKRSNAPLVVDAGNDGVVADAGDTAVDGVAATDGDAGSDGDADADDVGEVVALLPKGCTADADCDPLVFDQCHVAGCDVATGKCSVSNAKNGTPCDSGSACVEGASCKSGVCSGTQKVCNDDNPCTLDSCDLAIGCTATFVAKVCDDEDPCTLEDVCKDGTCAGTLRDCKEAETECATAFCNPSGGNCNLKAKEKGTPCDDGNPCTKDATCDGNQCKGKNACDDGDPCTSDACAQSGSGCVHLLLQGKSGPCNDADPCVIALCDEGKCVKTPKVCDDGEDCTSDACLPDGKCSFTKLLTGNCEDADPCTVEEACNKGQCKSTKALNCDDGNACTDDACVAFEGCTHKATTAKCNDGSACTVDDVCSAGKCTGKAKNCSDDEPCTVDSCDALTGTCAHASVPDGTSCAGGSCTSGSCAGGA
jgi:hypothetical protein